MYHDVVIGGDFESSGFPGRMMRRYKLPVELFQRHLEAMAGARSEPPSLIQGSVEQIEGPRPWVLTFDDGGSSAFAIVAECLERQGWRGHFFMVGRRINKPGFLTGGQIRDLRARGHVIGSHSYSNPDPMSSLSRDQLAQEWRRSSQMLADLLGEPVTSGSVPGGFYRRRVALAAAQVGMRAIFTSNPTDRPHLVAGCWVIGRYTMLNETAPEVAAGLVSGHVWPRLRQGLSWKTRGVAKMLGGPLYLRARRYLLERG